MAMAIAAKAAVVEPWVGVLAAALVVVVGHVAVGTAWVLEPRAADAEVQEVASEVASEVEATVAVVAAFLVVVARVEELVAVS